MRSRSSGGTLSIGEIAERYGLAPHVLRHWESVGLLSPDRDHNGRRRFGDADLVRIAIILRAKEGGLSLDDITAIVASPSASRRRAILQRQRDDLARRIAEAQTALDLIECALECRHRDLATCPDFQAAATDRIAARTDDGDAQWTADQFAELVATAAPARR